MNDFTDIVSKAMEVRPDEGDYTGKDGLLYCGKCHTPKEAYFEDGHAALFGRDRHPTNCACQQKRMDEKRLADQQRKHEDTVKELKKDCFDTPKLRDWCFAQDNGANPQMKHARFYADNFDTMLLDNIGYLLWGSVGTGKSFFAACIANALMEKEIPVRMTNFAAVLNDLSGSFEGRNAIHRPPVPLSAADSGRFRHGARNGLRAGTGLQRDRQPLPQRQAPDRHHQSEP